MFFVEAKAPNFVYVFTLQSPIIKVVIWIRGLSVEYGVIIIFIGQHNSSSPYIDMFES